MIANKEKCADKDSGVCDYNEYQRLRYFHGMLLDDAAFQAEQAYHIRKRRFLNRMLHGWGVVCGLELTGKKGDRSIDVTSGMALDCCGNEIWVPHRKPIDLLSLLPCEDKGKKEGECFEENEETPKSYYVGVRYYERPSSPVSVYLPSGSCEERTCENSRVKEGYCIELVRCNEKPKPEGINGIIKDLCACDATFKPEEKDLPVCPDYTSADPKELCQQLIMSRFCEQSVPCPECCSNDKPCFVVLGQIKIDKNCKLDSICLNECRRYVLTPRLLQHILLTVFTGALGEDGYIKLVDKEGKETFALPEVQDWVYNPMKAICAWLPNLVNDRRIEWLGCDKKPTNVDPQEFARIKQEVKELKVLVNAKAAPGPAEPLIVIPPEVADVAKPAEPEKGKKDKGSKPDQ